MPENDFPDLERLRAEIAACRICRDSPLRGDDDRLPHEPRPVAVISTTARILIAGQAPGLRVHDSGLPFNDASGDRLRQWLGVDRETFYDPAKFAIVPMGFCFPGYDAHGSDLPPRRECAPLWRPRLLDQLPNVELTLLVGGYAQAWALGARAKSSLAGTVAAWRDYLPAYLPMPHPSWRNTGWLKRNPWFEEEVTPYLRSRVRAIVAPEADSLTGG